MGKRAIFQLIDAATKSLPAEQAFLADLEASIQKSDKVRKPSPFYKPSSMHCLRNMYYQRIGEELTPSHRAASLVGITESGSDRHERIQKAVASMKANGFDCEYVDVAEFVKSRNLTDLQIMRKQGMETKLFNKKYNISFLCDGIIKYKGHYYVLEIKTETSRKHYERRSSKEAEDSHKTQATAYAVSFGIDDVIFLYENRDTCDKMTIFVHVTDEMKMDRVIGKIEECDGYVSRQIVPPKHPNKAPCKYCNYLNSCKRDGS